MKKKDMIISPASTKKFCEIGYNIDLLLPLIRDENFQKYLAGRKGEFSPELYGDMRKQIIFAQHQSYTSQLGGILLALSTQINKFKLLMDFCRLRRGEVAISNEQRNASLVGCYRSKSAHTYTSHVYAELKERFFKKMFDNNKTNINSSIFEISFETFVSEDNFYGLIENKFSLDNENYIGNSFYYNSNIQSRTYLEIIHSDFCEKHVEPIPYTYCEKLLKKGMESESLDELHQVTAEMFWIICAFKPFNFGDPSIAESMIRALYFYKGYFMPAWKEGIIPWVEATLCFKIDSFKEIFLSLLDGDFVISQTPNYKSEIIKNTLEINRDYFNFMLKENEFTFDMNDFLYDAEAEAALLFIEENKSIILSLVIIHRESSVECKMFSDSVLKRINQIAEEINKNSNTIQGSNYTTNNNCLFKNVPLTSTKLENNEEDLKKGDSSAATPANT